MFNDGYWWLMMVNDGQWWLMMVIDGYWWLMMRLWWLMMVNDGQWWFMMVHDGSWWLMMVNHLVGGFSPPLWNMMEFVSWDDDIPNTWKIIKFMFQTTNQLCMMFYLITPTWDDLQQSVDKWISGYVDKWISGIGFVGRQQNWRTASPRWLDGRKHETSQLWLYPICVLVFFSCVP